MAAVASPINYLEFLEDKSPAQSGFAWGGSRAVGTWLVRTTDTVNAISDVLGSVQASGQGFIRRGLPKAHPRWPALLANRIESVQGWASRDQNNVPAGNVQAQAGLQVPPLTSQYYSYGIDALRIEFLQPPFDLFADTGLAPGFITGAHDDGSSDSHNYWNEWDRFVDFEVNPNPELLTAQQGQSRFVTSLNAIAPTPAGPQPHGVPFSGFPRIYTDRGTVAMTWYRVPWSYVSSPNSYIMSLGGRVNQVDFAGRNFTFLRGSLLYTAAKIVRYLPPYPQLVIGTDGFFSFSSARVCDVTFFFDRTTRSQTLVPAPANASWVPAGWNLSPWYGGAQAGASTEYYYVIFPLPDPAGTNPNNPVNVNLTQFWRPIFKSGIYQKLFQDPDVPLA